jgi:hypothetical protein
VIHHIKTIDAHAGGEPLRLIVDGFPAPRGRSMLDKREWLAQHQDHLRRALVLEPRGHTDMYGAILTEAVSPGSHAGVLFMHNEGCSTMCGHGIIAVTTIALERGLLMPGGDGLTVIYDTPAGTVRATARLAADEVRLKPDTTTDHAKLSTTADTEDRRIEPFRRHEIRFDLRVLRVLCGGDFVLNSMIPTPRARRRPRAAACAIARGW